MGTENSKSVVQQLVARVSTLAITGLRGQSPAKVIAVGAVNAEQVFFYVEAALGVGMQMHADAVGAEFQVTLGEFICIEGLREVFGLADVNGVVARAQLFGAIRRALGDEVHAADRFELGVE